ncbi:hypothetical protein WCT78_00165 [Pectobacterium versatile]|uniref:hypothetical protein n=1 Tax=Pectobacterium TaxID=122277 RepID=UPI0018E064AE|nr:MULTISPECIES: hypothetical protein [Pectobacterium]MBI0472739.1 hypothetical protein [Pectobacterium parmentieri]MBI0495380.1 hypothetical protein [Pectobacterium parmentieri]MBI0569910.1 hypothetical protein [Pectobacterium parmentieri]MBI0574627.1 hypothetical protein [Pectobacterium parmentieri]MCQ8232890.1 hypothetical protein [Pectobacterium carotovorum]
MIDPQYGGRELADLPDEIFEYGFDPDERFPALVLASVITVPVGSGESWRLAIEDCGGFSCDYRAAAVLPLSIRPDIVRVLEQIVEEDFSPDRLDYFTMFDSGQVAAVKRGYLTCLQAAGLSCSPDNLDRLTQALYPVDATPENLAILSGESIDLSAIAVSHGLVIFIVGQNCD